MRGKKSDPEFVSQFISECVQQGIISTEDIVAAARGDIQNIDDKIKEVENLKILRSKLLDVIMILDKPILKTEEARLLPFFRIEHPQLCKHICDMLQECPVLDTDGSDQLDEDTKFCLKQLMEYKIIARSGKSIIQGEKFQEYMEFVLQGAR